MNGNTFEESTLIVQTAKETFLPKNDDRCFKCHRTGHWYLPSYLGKTTVHTTSRSTLSHNQGTGIVHRQIHHPQKTHHLHLPITNEKIMSVSIEMD